MDRYPRRDDLREMSGYHSPQVSVKVRLNTNESPIEPPAEFLKALAAAVSDVKWNRYPDRAAHELRAAIGALHSVGPENVFVANGSNEVLQAVLLSYSGAGRTVATFEPTYQLHSHIARIAGATVVNGKRNPDFTLDVSEVRRVCAEFAPSVTFLCSPNNPTGMAEDPAVVKATVEHAPGVVVVDEAYAQFSPHTALDYVSEGSKVAVSRTFSKTWSMAAARLGYLVAPKWMISDLEIVTLPYHLDA
ncbi:MAG: aminotransferase class I/II-fold pyridoxal phosphate-dependent enzyme, partial [Actinomycetota bacterium]